MSEIVAPPRVDLSVEAEALYAEMRSEENLFLADLLGRGCRIWTQNSSHEFDEQRRASLSHQLFDPVAARSASEKFLRRHIVLVPESRQPALLCDWQQLLDRLAPTRHRFAALVRELAHEQGIDRPGAGERSTALPRWFGPAEFDGPRPDLRGVRDDGATWLGGMSRVAERVTYTTGDAFRAAVLDGPAIADLLRRRLRSVEKRVARLAPIEVAAGLHDDHDDVRLQREIQSDLRRLPELESKHGRLVARASSGVSTKISVWWRGGDDIPSLPLPHVTLISAGESCVVMRASQRARTSRYGEPVASMLNGRLMIYRDPGPRATTQ